MTWDNAHLTALFGRPPTDDERAAASAQAARLVAGITNNPILRAGDLVTDSQPQPADLIDLSVFRVPAP